MRGDFINNYFGFNRQQRNGLFVLVLLSFLLLVLRLGYPLWIVPGKIVILNLPLIEQKINSADTFKNNYSKKHYSTGPKKTTLFSFDPNTVNHEELIRLGFGEKRTAIFLKFRSRGFVFKTKTDLQKVFGVKGHLYDQLAPYIKIKHAEPGGPQKKETTEDSKWQTKKPAQLQVQVELNASDSTALESLPGIGKVFAKRIVKYRTLLGGFVSTNQLKEVYGFNQEMFEKLKSTVTVNGLLVKKIDLNKDDFKTLNKHPYLSYELTKTLCNSRRNTPVTAGNLKEIMASDSLYTKLLPYLRFD